MNLEEIKKEHPSFCKWMEEKKLSPSELSILKLLSKEQAQSLLNWIALARPSHSLGVEILELSSELLLMDKLEENVFQTIRQPKVLLKKLKKWRYPLSLGEDERKSKYIQTLSWPKEMKGQWVRQNDKSGLTVRLTAFSLKNLEEKIEFLKFLHQKIKKDKALWKN